jgi:NADH-quinone oxidoreductase subunit F
MTLPRKITDPQQLPVLCDQSRRAIEARMSGAGDTPLTHCILLCAGGGCIASGAMEVKAALQQELKKNSLDKKVTIFETGCLGPCAVGPVIVVYPEGVFYENLKPEHASRIVKEHLKKGAIVNDLVHKRPATGTPVPALKDLDFLNKQTKIVLRNCGVIDPLSIDEYIGREGYLALAKVLTGMNGDQVIDIVKKSGIRGRGGAGFPTWLKWSLTKKAAGDEKFVLCNGDEGDPGAFMDRSVLEGDPHSVIEAMAIAAYAIGAKQGYVYVRAEYPLAVERLGKAIDAARAMGLLGQNIMGTPFCFDLEIRMGSGAFVCGEETALMTSIEGNRGEPRPRPPFPANKGLWNKPSVLNNVETYAAIPAIILKGADWYASFGTEKSKGTKVFALAGAVTNTGLVEIPIGTPLNEIIFDIGGGIPAGKEFKAAQIGGPSGGCIPKQHLDVPVDYESLAELGAIMGSGGLIVMDESACMVDVARFFLDFVQDESCGKCVPCRVGTKRMLEILERICRGEGEEGDVERLIDLGNAIKDTALCGLGQTAPNPVLSTIRYFRHEYDAHIRDRYCSTMVCKRISPAPCQRACPAGVDVSSYNGLIAHGKYNEALEVIRQDNPFPGVCGRLCNRACEAACTLGETEEPVAIRSLKRFVADYERKRWKPAPQPLETKYAEKVAVIGAGPAGLTTALELKRAGYPVTVFEAAKKAGGMLRLAVPDFKLPSDVVDCEVQAIVQSGVELRTGVQIGKSLTIKDLQREGYKAILIATGAHKTLKNPLEKGRGCLQAVDVLKALKAGKKPKLPKKICVVGTTHAALDVARAAVRLGCTSVSFIYEREKSQLPFDNAEVKAAEQEGVDFRCLHRPVSVESTKGAVKGLRCFRCAANPADETGRSRSVPTPGKEIVLPAEAIIFASAQAADEEVLRGCSSLKTNGWGVLDADPDTLMTKEKGVFAAGDVTIGAATAIEAVAAGQKAAAAIHRFLRGIEDKGQYRLPRPRRRVESADAAGLPEGLKRQQEKSRPAEERRRDFIEADITFTEEPARYESLRCLRCNLD